MNIRIITICLCLTTTQVQAVHFRIRHRNTTTRSNSQESVETKYATAESPMRFRFDGGPDRSTPDMTSEETRMLNAINNYRSVRKLLPLRVDPVLQRIAMQRVRSFSHYQPEFGGWVHDQARRLGYIATDNIAQGYQSGIDAVGDGVSGWGDERPGRTVGHDKQMKGYIKINGEWIDQNFDLCGVARSGANYIAVFGRRN